MSWFTPTPKTPEPLYDAYRFVPKPDITAHELAIVLSKTASGREGLPFGWIVMRPAGSPIPEPATRHFALLARSVTLDGAWETARIPTPT